VPYILYDSRNNSLNGVRGYTESEAANAGSLIPGCELLSTLLERN
jgi:hypothetical protein